MASIINANTSAGLISTGDTSGVLQLQTAGTTALTIDGSQNTSLSQGLTVAGNVTLSAGTANGIVYLNGSKVATTGTALTFDGTNFGLGASNNLLVGTTTNTNSSKIVSSGTISETVSSVQYLVASQADVGTAPNEIPLNQYLGTLAFKNVLGLNATLGPAPTIASAATIQPTAPITFISGTTTISTITVPPEFVGGGSITLIPTALWSTNTSGNIALGTTGVVSKALILTYDAGTAKWYPSY